MDIIQKIAFGIIITTLYTIFIMSIGSIIYGFWLLHPIAGIWIALIAISIVVINKPKSDKQVQ